MATAKTYTIKKHRRNGISEAVGTLAELTQRYSNTLANGNSYDKSITLNPSTVNKLVAHLNKTVKHTQRGSFNPDYYSLAK